MSSFPTIINDYEVTPELQVIGRNVIFQCDALTLLRQIPTGSIDVIWSSPPYNLKDPFRPGRPKKPGKPLKKYRYEGGTGKGDGWWMPEEEYQQQQIRVLDEWARILHPEHGVAFYSHRPRTVDWELVHPLKWIYQSRLVPLQQIVWWHNGTQNRDHRRFWFEHEVVIPLAPTAGPRLKNLEPQPSGKKGLGDVWYIPRDGKARQAYQHPATAHPVVVRHSLAAVPEPEGKVVLDCYAGVGTTAVVAREFGMDWLLGEVSFQYCQRAQERIGRILL